MPVTQVSICNRSLIRCGAARIQSISENTPAAVLLNAIYNQTRDDVLRAHPWNFAVKRVVLAPTATTPEWGFDYQYDLPNDCLRLLPGVYNGDGSVAEHQVESDADGTSKVIRTDESELEVRYIMRHENEAFWDSNFASAFAWKLAMEIAYSLTQSVALVQACEKAYRAALAEARSMDGVEGSAPQLEADDWTNSRL